MRLPDDLLLYLVLGAGDCRGRAVEEVVEAAVAGGATCVQLREKRMESATLAALGWRVKAILKPAGVPLVINDDIEAAIACDADGLHVGQEDMPPAAARRALPATMRLGLSITGPADLPTARPGEVDHLGLGPVYRTATKADAAPALGLAGLAALRAAVPDFPVVAIGGITLANAGSVMAMGVDGVAVVSAITGAEDPQRAARDLRAAVEQTLHERKEGR